MKIKNITPVHIGDGEEIIPWEYAIESGKLNIYPIEHIVKELNKNYSGQRLRNILLSLRDNVKHKGYNSNFGIFLREQSISIEPLYRIPLQTQLKNGEYKSVKSFIKNMEGVYIPGSEVKGALRTVFLFGVIWKELKKENYSLMVKVARIIKNSLFNPPTKGKDVWKMAFNRVENLIFRERSPDKKDAKYDLFKAVVVSDTKSAPPEDVLYIDGITILGSSRRRFSEPHELLKPNTTFEISIDIDKAIKNALKKSTGNPHIDLLTEEFLHESALRFAELVLKEDIKFFESKGFRMPPDISKIENALAKKEFPIRVGKHQGFLSTTVMIMLKLGDAKFYEKFFQKVITESNKPPNKTRKTTQSGSVLGWCILKEIPV